MMAASVAAAAQSTPGTGQRPVFQASGAQGTTAPSGYAAGVNEEDTDRARSAVAGTRAADSDVVRGGIAAMEAAHARSPADAAATVRLARGYIASCEGAKAEQLLAPLTIETSRNAEAWLALGEAQASLGQAGAAMASYRRSATLEPTEANAVVCGEGLLTLSPADALSFFEEQVRVHAESAQLWAELGASQIAMGREDAAARSLLHAAELDTDAVLPVMLMAQLHGLPAEVLADTAAHVQTYVVAHPESARAHEAYALTLWTQEGEAPGAQQRPVLTAELRRSLALNAGLTESRRLLGLVEQQAGENADAAREFEQVLQQDPQDATASYHLAQVYRDLGESAKADAQMQRFRSLQQEHAPRLPGAAHTACP